MANVLKQFGFAGVVMALLLLAAGAVGVKLAMDAMSGAGGGPQAAAPAGAGGPGAGGAGARPGGGPQGAGGGPGGGQGGGRGPDAPRVVVETVAMQPFYDAVQALGTAQARESVTITSKVTDVIQALRFDSGDRVSRGQVLVVLASVEQQADLAEARAQLDAAKRDFERFQELGERGFAPAARVEEARAGFERAEARVSALQARIADRTIRAPFSGVIGLRTASPGTLARPGDPIATLDDASVIKLDFDIAENQIPIVRRGAVIQARSAAVEGRVFNGTVDDVDSRLNPNTRTLRVRALLPNPDGALKPGMLLTVVVRHNPREALSVPEIALLERTDGMFVYRVDTREGRATAALAPVRVGRRVDGRAEILDGVKPGEVIVVEGVQRVQPGRPVQAIPAQTAAAPATAKAAPPAAQRAPAAARPAAQAPARPTAQPPAQPPTQAPVQPTAQPAPQPTAQSTAAGG